MFRLIRSHTNRLVALIPPEHACSDSSDVSSNELEIPNKTSDNHDSSDESSLISVDSALEALNILEFSEDEYTDINASISLPLTPILQNVFPSQNEPNYDAIPSISSCISDVQTDQPTIITCSTRKRKKAQKKKVVSKKLKTSKKFVLSYKWKRELFFHRAEIHETTPLMPTEDDILVYMLRENYGIFCTGTIRGNRLRGCESVLPSDKELKKKPLGSFAQGVCNQNKLAVVNSCVDTHPVDKIKRYSKEHKAKVDVDCPKIVKNYNKNMGGVDLADMLISLYKIPLKTRRWYLSIFAQLIDISINNAWLLYRQNKNKEKSLKEFRLDIFESLVKKGKPVKERSDITGDIKEDRKIKKPVVTRPIEDIRYDQVGHFPDSCSYGRCRYCKDGKTNVICIKCNQRLRFVAGKRNCFLNFHNK
ncbi:hypothetical protein HW555_011918 [Spodoptera exigua]|uniref:PiggyBac transposable element-derived protein domain-containing protein n=1 Tax=Spodoptera exigua TaxID=7107 RepID=A0A835L175_SPOEX|nr:hypothetical protein HW555_011918 [Spodoptera exigua]